MTVVRGGGGRAGLFRGLLLAALQATGPACAAGDSASPDWPCVQRKVPVISAATVWTGPEVADDDRRWQDQADIAGLVQRTASRRMPLEDAYAAIDAFAARLGADRREKLTFLFAGLLQTINLERAQIMQGIERYTRRQKELANKIKAERAELDLLRAQPALNEEQAARRKDLEQAFQWDARVFDERRESLSYVCEAPVLLEQRIFALARHVMSLLDL
jgi:hypothetical protein